MNKSINPIYAKPSGITLGEHTRSVRDQAKLILSRLPFLCEKYTKLCQEDLNSRLDEAAYFHDWGKVHPKWQSACQKDHKDYLQWRKENNLSPHENSADDYRRYEFEMRQTGRIPGRHLFSAGFRHEMDSLLRLQSHKDFNPSLPVQIAIAAHHGKLGYRHKIRWRKDRNAEDSLKGPFAPLWDNFEAFSGEIADGELRDVVLKRYEFSAIRALLRLADTRASRIEGEGEDAHYELNTFPSVHRFPSLRPVQEAALNVADRPISILRAPTGSGKTYAALLWAEHQVKQSRADRLIIAMPTRFTSTALAISAADQIGETGLYHSSAWYNKFGGKTGYKALKDALEAHRMARYLATPVTVCTIDHLLMALTGTREDHHSTFFFLCNAAVVFDEADFYDPFVQANMVVLIEVLEMLQVPILVMSATVPDSARRLYKVPDSIAVAKRESRTAKKLLHFIADDEKARQDAMKEMIRRGEGIIYANTITRALMYFDLLREVMGDHVVPVTLYHSRFTEADKKKIEERLIRDLGKNAWEKKSKGDPKGIAIMTQIGEMSVNISTTVMLSDLCPWDRLAQRIGRLARFDFQEFGLCYVVTPSKNDEIYPAPYGFFDRKLKRWQPGEPFNQTLEDLELNFKNKNEITPEIFVDYVNRLYPDVPKFDSHTQSNQRIYKEMIRNNWLIVPNLNTDEEDGLVGPSWSSRRIPPQETVFIKPPESVTDYSDLQRHKLAFGVSIPQYQIKKELKKGKSGKIREMEVIIQKQDDSIFVYFSDHYNIETGLVFDK